MLEWQHECGPVRDALKLQATRTPGQVVEGWTDRPRVADEFLPYWESWCDWASAGEFTPSSAIAWVGSQFAGHDAAARAVLVTVWMRLARRQAAALAAKTPVPSPGDVR